MSIMSGGVHNLPSQSEQSRVNALNSASIVDATCQSYHCSNVATEQQKLEPKKSLQSRMQHCLDVGEFCDVSFLVGDSRQQFNAHRVLLGAVSPVFLAMFNSPLQRQGDDDIGNNSYELEDIEPVAFRNLLVYAYTDCTHGIDNDSVFQTLYAAKKYLIEGLVSDCCQYLRQHLTVENALIVLEHCMFLEVPSVVQPCLRLICQQWERVSAELLGHSQNRDLSVSESYSTALIACVLSQDGLPCDEMEIFNWLLRWADANGFSGADVTSCLNSEEDTAADPNDIENVRSRRIAFLTPELLSCVRFPRMSRRQIGQLVAPTRLLTCEQLVQILTWTSENDLNSVANSNISLLNARPRNPCLPGEPELLSLCDLSVVAAAARPDTRSVSNSRFPVSLPPSVSTLFSANQSLETTGEISGVLQSSTIAALVTNETVSSHGIYGCIEIRPSRRVLLTGLHLFRQQQQQQHQQQRTIRQEPLANPVSSVIIVSADITLVDDDQHYLIRRDNEPALICNQIIRHNVGLIEVLFPRAIVLLPGCWYRLTLYVHGIGQQMPSALSLPSLCRLPCELEGRAVGGGCGAKLELRAPSGSSSSLVSNPPCASFLQALYVCWV